MTIQTIVEPIQKICRNCMRWELLTPEKCAFIGVPDGIIVGRCPISGRLMDEDWPCVVEDQFLPLESQTCDTCKNINCKEYGKTNQGCRDWRG